MKRNSLLYAYMLVRIALPPYCHKSRRYYLANSVQSTVFVITGLVCVALIMRIIYLSCIYWPLRISVGLVLGFRIKSSFILGASETELC